MKWSEEIEAIIGNNVPRLVLIVDHDGVVNLKSCDDCTGSTEEVLDILEAVAEGIKEHA